MAVSDLCTEPTVLKIVSFNMHGYNQGFSAINEMISTANPDVFLCQEHWLTPANLHKFHDDFKNYLSFGSTAISNQVESGVLKGRPFGGLMTLVKTTFEVNLKPCIVMTVLLLLNWPIISSLMYIYHVSVQKTDY